MAELTEEGIFVVVQAPVVFRVDRPWGKVAGIAIRRLNTGIVDAIYPPRCILYGHLCIQIGRNRRLPIDRLPRRIRAAALPIENMVEQRAIPPGHYTKLADREIAGGCLDHI